LAFPIVALCLYGWKMYLLFALCALCAGVLFCGACVCCIVGADKLKDKLKARRAAKLQREIAAATEQSLNPDFILTVQLSTQSAGENLTISASTIGGEVRDVLLNSSVSTVGQLRDKLRRVFEVTTSRRLQLFTIAGTVLEDDDVLPAALEDHRMSNLSKGGCKKNRKVREEITQAMWEL